MDGMIRISKARRGLMGVFLACLLVLIGCLGASHGHDTGHGHHECDICQVSAQPYMGAKPAIQAEPPPPPELAPEGSKSTFSIRRSSPFSSRAPPAF